MTTKPYNSLLDERCMTIWTSPAGKRHVEGWYGETLCGCWIDNSSGWHYGELTSVRWLGKLAQGIGYGSSLCCKRCFANYKDVDTNG